MKNPHSLINMSSVGTPLYQASEVWYNCKRNSSIDVFSAGVVVYETIYGKTPWVSKTITGIDILRKK